ncbi:MAG: response regulator [Sneathiella sp.]|nr:response regulator [Sneathiella sp.]
MLILIALGLLFFEQQTERHIAQEEISRKKEQVQRAAQEFRLKLSLCLAEAVQVLYGLKSYIEANPTFNQQEFDRYAASIKRAQPAIRNVVVAPNLIVRFTYPLKGNEAVVGLNYRKAPLAQRASVFRAIEEGKPVISGPVDLVQGGRALILRIPVYIQNIEGGRETWGIVAAPVDMNILFLEAGIEEFVKTHDLAIRGHDGLGAEGAVFYGDKKLFGREAQSIQLDVALKNGSWILAIKPKEGWPNTSAYHTVLRYSFLVVFLIIGAVWVTAIGYFRERALSRNRKKAAYKERSEFLEILSHEIRSPLQGVLGAQKYLLDNGITEPMRSIVEAANQSGEYIKVLINDYLDLQRAESDNLPVNLALTDIREIIEKSVKMLSVGQMNENVSLNYYISENVPSALLIDQAKINQILVNIIGNAQKFTHNGFIILNVSYRDRNENPSLIISVEDTGVGIERESLPGLFDRFTRSKKNETSPGSGLGLAIARSLARAMDGDITVQSEIDKGSSFMIELPAKEVQRTNNQTVELIDQDLDAGVSSSDVVWLKEVRILIADDVAINRMLLNAMLSPIAKKVTIVADGKEVLEALERATFDVLIMDVQMPNMDGLEATKYIRDHPSYMHLPIVGLTGEEAAEQQNQLLAAGMNAVLTKPISFEPLLDKLRECYDT